MADEILNSLSQFANIRKYYCTVYSHLLSDYAGHGIISLAADSYGKISVFRINSLIGQGKRDATKPTRVIQGHSGPVYHILKAGDVLLSTAGDKIKVWNMSDIVDPGGQITAPIRELSDVSNSGVLRMCYSEQMGTLFAAYEDGHVRGWDIETGQQKVSFAAHKSSTYCVCQRPDTAYLATGGGDGCVYLWDARNVATPTKSTVIGKSSWISCLDIDSGGNWMVCGGNFKPTLHHMSTLTKSATLSLGGTTYSARFYEDRLITGGSNSNLYHWSPNGTRLLKVPCSSRSILSLSVLPLTGNSQQILSVSGDCTSIDIFTNYGYKAFSLETE